MGSRIKSKDARSLSGYLISNATPTNGEVLKYSSSSNKYEPSSSGGVSASDIGAGLTYNTTTNKVDLGGYLNFNDASNASNNIFFAPATTGSNIVVWGLGANYTPVSASYIARFDIFTVHGKHEIHGDFQSATEDIGLYQSTTGTSCTKQYKDVTQILGSGSGFPGPNDGMTYQKVDDRNQDRIEIWESEASNTKSYVKQTFNEFHWQVFGSNNYFTEIKANRTIFNARIINPTGTGISELAVRLNGIQLRDEFGQGIATVPNGTIVGNSGGSFLDIESAATDSKYKDASTNKKGIKYEGFGESNSDTGAGANYSTLVNTSLVPKKYVDDAITSIGSASPLTTKGDLYSFDTNNARLPVGTNGQILVADSNEATGLKWQGNNTIGTKVVVEGKMDTTQGISANTTTRIDFVDTVDVNSEWDDSTHKFTVGASGAGTYQFTNSLFFQNNNGYSYLCIYKNGTKIDLNYGTAYYTVAGNTWESPNGTINLELAVGDYIEFYVRSTTGFSFASQWYDNNIFQITKIGDSVTIYNAPAEPRIVSVASTATLTVSSSTTDQSIITAQAEALTIAAPTGTPVEGQKLIIRIKDNGSARGITFNAIFRALGVTLPTTTTANKTVYIGCIYNITDTKWDVVAVKQEA